MALGSGVAAGARRRLGRFLHGRGIATRADIVALRSAANTSHAEIESLRAALHEAHAELAHLSAQAQALDGMRQKGEGRLRALERLAAIDAVSRFIEHAPLSTTPLVSVVLPTYNRPEHLARAIDSIRAQSYTNWELLVVDDGGQLDSRSVVERAADRRIRWMRIVHQGVCAARNAALAVATGALIAYADDDNVMDPGWLRAVVWAFAQRPDVDVLYGAVVVDDLMRVQKRAPGELPQTFLHDWDREHLKQSNLADMGTVAHRGGLPEARFDEGLREMGDWDLLLRLTAERDPLVLPAVACYYSSDAPNRLTSGPTHSADLARVLDRAAVGNAGARSQ